MADKKEDKENKALAKVLDEKDENFCGFCCIQLLDQDGMQGKTLGMSSKSPVHITSGEAADPVVMEALFQVNNPLFYLEIRQEEQFYVWGQFWVDGPKHSESNNFVTMTPLRAQDAHKQMEKSGTQEFVGEGICDFLKGSTSRPMKITFATEEKKFKTKLAKATITVPREAWKEFKDYRVKMWRSGKNWAGSEDKDDEKDKKDKEEEK